MQQQRAILLASRGGEQISEMSFLTWHKFCLCIMVHRAHKHDVCFLLRKSQAPYARGGLGRGAALVRCLSWLHDWEKTIYTGETPSEQCIW
jgi:hypothetical protein